jgi:hypothetical protein
VVDDCLAGKGYGSDADTWEPLSHLRNVRADIAQFEASQQPPGSAAGRQAPQSPQQQVAAKSREGMSRFRGVSPHGPGRWRAIIQANHCKRHLGSFTGEGAEERAARAYDAAAREVHGPAAVRLLNFRPPDYATLLQQQLKTLQPSPAACQQPVAKFGLQKPGIQYTARACSSRYRGVSWNSVCQCWVAKIMHGGKRLYLGRWRGSDGEERAARAFDDAARQIRGPHTPVNFPCAKKVRGKQPAKPRPRRVIDQQRRARPRKQSQFRGVCWHSRANCWTAQICHNGKRNHIGCFRGEGATEAAARAYDERAKELMGTKAVLNFPAAQKTPTSNQQGGQKNPKTPTCQIEQPPAKRPRSGPVDAAAAARIAAASIAAARKQPAGPKAGAEARSFLSQYRGVSWRADSHCWVAQITVDGAQVRLGRFRGDGGEEAAARKYDEAARRLHRPEVHLNFSSAAASDAAVRKVSVKRSRFRGVSWVRDFTCWEARVKAGHKQHYLGRFRGVNAEEKAARAYDKAARKLHGKKAYLNFPTVREQKTLSRRCRFRGVTYRPVAGSWEVSIRHQGKPLYIGKFHGEGAEEAAARAYDKTARQLHGRQAVLNFPDTSTPTHAQSTPASPAVAAEGEKEEGEEEEEEEGEEEEEEEEEEAQGPPATQASSVRCAARTAYGNERLVTSVFVSPRVERMMRRKTWQVRGL